MTSKAKAEKPTPENKAATSAPKNKGATTETVIETPKDPDDGDDGSEIEIAPRKFDDHIKSLDDAELIRSLTEGRKVIETMETELASRGLSADNAVRTAAIKEGFDHGETIMMVFVQSGTFNLDNGGRIHGREGEECALSKAEAERAIESGLMVAKDAEADEADASE